MSLILRWVILPFVALHLAGSLSAQTLTNLGPNAPIPGTNDIGQLSTRGKQTWPDGLNYFTDNNPPVGQTFTTGTNAMNLVSAAIKTAGLNSGNGYGTPANSTNSFSLKVSDNGTPSMSATQGFSVVVNPLSAPGISNVSVGAGQFSFSVSGQSGPDYAIETSTNLTQWRVVLITNSPALPFIWTEAATNLPHRFYCAKLGPPLP
jgi:hypothetical protein